MNQQNKNYLPTLSALIGVSLIGMYVAYKQDKKVAMDENSLEYKIYKSRKDSREKAVNSVNNAVKEKDLLQWMNKMSS